MYIRLEHVNVTSPNPQKTANWMQKFFDWSMQWEGDTQDNGYSIHIGDTNSYIAIYKPGLKSPPISDLERCQDTSIMLGLLLMIWTKSNNG
jgi:hypothetical protein